MAKTKTHQQVRNGSEPPVPALTVVPAYGRDYQTAEAAVADWNAEKDFCIMDISSPWNGKYVNRQQVPGTEVKIRYRKLQDIVFVLDGNVTGRVDEDNL